ncbi:MAG: phosphate ABC transporter ATP-binding protein [Chloroflexi bacterium]|uniref:Phosphate ABC transporter ATP-binding protein n=1 Tax=Candidatus Chlorohelix allophototropha TaxID=3003348 RepID=A0A8T7M8D0_9CHLR|nr:phosphate ABC transporter ATP-binding protein [Chloroflexota bacterium]WJW68199.1 phosphate ABC transporter ATP-binding protein PstB [Chloroflexota bacterium L227-S17]
MSAEAPILSGVSRKGQGIDIQKVNIFYGKKQAVRNVSLHIEANKITAFIGPSGCGKTTLLRSLNRMIETIPGARVEGKIMLDNQEIYEKGFDAALLRQKIGMVWQRPNPFPSLSIRENVISGLRIVGESNQKKLDEVAEDCLRRAFLWDEVKDKLDQPGTSLSGGQQQRLCIARTVAVEPEVILMDEPCAALDPLSTLRVEELMLELKKSYTIVIVTHNMQQAARVSDKTAFMLAGEERVGELVEYAETKKVFINPNDERTERYISGRFG